MIPLLLALMSAPLAAELPTISTHDLNQSQVVIPDQLRGERNLLLMGFTRAQQEEVETWLPYEAELAGLELYQVPMMGPMAGFLRLIIERAMKAEKTTEERARMIPVYVEVEPVLAALEITDTSTMAAVLVDGQGQVLWVGRGPATRELVAAVPR